MDKVLVVDDEELTRRTLSEILNSNHFHSLESSNGRDAIGVFEKEMPAAVLLDLQMPDMDGIETMQELKKVDPDIPIIIITAHGDISTAVEAIKLGAYDFIVKPPKFDRLIMTLKRAIEKLELKRTVKRLNATLEASLEWMFGNSGAIKAVIDQIYQVASSDFSIIIQGETGTGKSVVARAIHNLSRRAKEPFITVDMGAIPETLVENELFGHERGAFTGAEKKKKGFFEIANRGTILIDEMQNMSPYVQSKLLRVVEEKEVYPLGSTSPVGIDIRIISTTNTDIRKAVKGNRFREDLFFRLGEFMITIPPLKERVEDILFLAQKFLVEASTDLNKYMIEIADDAADLLRRYPWPGNVRELRNIIRKAILLSNDSVIRAGDINFLNNDEHSDGDSSIITIKDAEKMVIKKALALTKGNKTKAASILQIDYKTLLTKIRQYGI